MSEPLPHTIFRNAVYELSGSPTPANVQRYLAASRLLDRAKRKQPPAGRRIARRAA